MTELGDGQGEALKKGRCLGWLLGTFYISDKLQGRSSGGISPQTLNEP